MNINSTYFTILLLMPFNIFGGNKALEKAVGQLEVGKVVNLLNERQIKLTDIEHRQLNNLVHQAEFQNAPDIYNKATKAAHFGSSISKGLIATTGLVAAFRLLAEKNSDKKEVKDSKHESSKYLNSITKYSFYRLLGISVASSVFVGLCWLIKNYCESNMVNSKAIYSLLESKSKE